MRSLLVAAEKYELYDLLTHEKVVVDLHQGADGRMHESATCQPGLRKKTVTGAAALAAGMCTTCDGRENWRSPINTREWNNAKKLVALARSCTKVEKALASPDPIPTATRVRYADELRKLAEHWALTRIGPHNEGVAATHERLASRAKGLISQLRERPATDEDRATALREVTSMADKHSTHAWHDTSRCLLAVATLDTLNADDKRLVAAFTTWTEGNVAVCDTQRWIADQIRDRIHANSQSYYRPVQTIPVTDVNEHHLNGAVHTWMQHAGNRAHPNSDLGACLYGPTA